MKKLRTASFARALRTVRKACGRSQEEFDQVSSRTYVSSLERGLKQPTLGKVDELARVMGVHPLALLTLSYCGRPADASQVLEAVRSEITRLGIQEFD